MSSEEEIIKLKKFHKGVKFLLKRQILFLKHCLFLSKENYKLTFILKKFKKALFKKNNKS